jgi:glutaredoxin
MKPIKLYTTLGCPHCRAAKAYLEEAGLDYEEIDVTTTPGARNELVARGVLGVPAFAIGGKMVQGFHKDQIMKAVKKARIG